MTSIDPRGPKGTRTQPAPRDGRPGGEADRRRALSRSTLWPDADRGRGTPVGPQPLRARWDPVPPPRARVGQRPRAAQRDTRRSKRRSSLGWFVHHYGWRAYAIPILAALTVIAVVGIISAPGSDTDSAQAAGADGSATMTVTELEPSVATVTVTESGVVTTITRAVGGDSTAVDDGDAPADIPHIAPAVPERPAINRAEAFRGVVMGLLPPGPAFAKTGAGTFHIVPGTSERIGGEGRLWTFTVEVEDGISSPADDTEFADAVVSALSGAGSWAAADDVSLRRVDSGNPDFRISLTSQMTARHADYCGWDVQLEASCYNQAVGRVIINMARWVRGAYSYGEDLVSYREYAVNHEVGHALGHNHEGCPTDGGIAPVMMQQSWSTSDDDIAALNPGTGIDADGKVCRANPFPYPDRIDG